MALSVIGNDWLNVKTNMSKWLYSGEGEISLSVLNKSLLHPTCEEIWRAINMEFCILSRSCSPLLMSLKVSAANPSWFHLCIRSLVNQGIGCENKAEGLPADTESWNENHRSSTGKNKYRPWHDQQTVLIYTWFDRIGKWFKTSIDNMISQLFRSLPKFAYNGDILLCQTLFNWIAIWFIEKRYIWISKR